MPLQKETVAIPVTKGVNLRSAARLVDPPGLLEAKNARFSGAGSSKRYGHTASIARAGTYPAATTRPDLEEPTSVPFGAKTIDSDWLFGWGDVISLNGALSGSPYEVSPYPEAGYLFGVTTRDDEVLGWNGHQLYPYAPSQDLQGRALAVNPAVMPALKAKPIAKVATTQQQADAADNGRVRVVCWLNTTASPPTARYSIFDSVTGATLVNNAAIAGVTEPFNPRCFTLSNYIHILVVDRDNDTLVLKSIEESNLNTITTASQGSCVNYYDYWKVDETAAVILRNDATDLKTSWITASGSSNSEYAVGTIDINDSAPLQCAIRVQPQTKRLGVAWINDGAGVEHPNEAIGATFYQNGTLIGSYVAITSLAAGVRNQPNRITIAPRYLLSLGAEDFFYAYVSLSTGTLVTTYKAGITPSGLTGNGTRYNVAIASKAFRVGERIFFWASNYSTLQSTWLLLDDDMLPVGKMDFSVANVQALNIADTGGENATICSVNWVAENTPTDVQNTVKFCCALGYKLRVDTTSDTVGLFTEPSIKFVELDFLPALRAAQAGRCTYFAGAQLWSYDGTELTEAGFHLCPEPTLAKSAGGVLTATGTYSYRVDLCYRNAKNEEIRSHSILTQTTLAGAEQTITLTIPTVITRRTNAYFLIFRNAMVGGSPTTTWNLINSRDPSSADYVANSFSVASRTYVDAGAVTDSAGLARELHPANVGNSYLHPFSAPACEIVTAGRDRLWVAGGELLPGQVAPSRLFDVAEVPAFNSNINVQVDRGDEPITALGFVGEVAVVFRKTAAYVLEGDGPDNVSSGYFAPARLATSDVGAVSQESLGRISAGLAFQSLTGYRLIGPSGQIVPIGADIDALARDFRVTGTVVCPVDQEIRWYGPTGAHVFQYLDGVWSTWTCAALGAVFCPDTGRAVLARYNGQLWFEDASVFMDNDSVYEHRITFPWLHAGALGDFQRICSIAGFGTAQDDGHDIRVEIAYDERDFAEEYWEWSYPDASQNTDTWGAANWGDGVWGDTASTSGGLRDAVWRWRRDPRIQKCSVFSVAISDNFSQTAGFSLVALGLRLARKTGLDRIPAVTGGSNVVR